MNHQTSIFGSFVCSSQIDPSVFKDVFTQHDKLKVEPEVKLKVEFKVKPETVLHKIGVDANTILISEFQYRINLEIQKSQTSNHALVYILLLLKEVLLKEGVKTNTFIDGYFWYYKREEVEEYKLERTKLIYNLRADDESEKDPTSLMEGTGYEIVVDSISA